MSTKLLCHTQIKSDAIGDEQNVDKLQSELNEVKSHLLMLHSM